MKQNFLVKAVPVWPRCLAGVQNATAGFRVVFTGGKDGVLRLAGASLYRVTLNGAFLAHGPARAAHGFARVDELRLDGKLKRGKNILAIEVAGYELPSYYLPCQPSFLCAELEVGGKIVAATGGDGFTALEVPGRRTKVQRFSFQRMFIEDYQLAPDMDAWRTSPAWQGGVPCHRAKAPGFLPRGVPEPDYTVRTPVAAIAAGRLVASAPAELWKDRSLTNPKNGGYREDELESVLSNELQCFKSVRTKTMRPKVAATLNAREWMTLDFGVEWTGFIGLRAVCREPARLVLTFDEILAKGDVDFKRLTCVNAIRYDLAPGDYALESIEPYSLRYLKIQVLEGAVGFSGVFLRELANPDAGAATFESSDAALDDIFEAGRNTFRQNALDIFMDCPSRERAGWLCDSYFAARVEADLCGHNKIERNFLENFLLPDSFEGLPQGMLPMCYPADHRDGCYIPNFAMWFLLELEEHVRRTGGQKFAAAFGPKVEALLGFFKRFENKDGLLERLERWVFVEWSKAGDFVQDVNYPTNMLYAAALDAAGRVFGNRQWRTQAAALRETIRAQSFDGEFFVDNAVRENNRLKPTRNRTETCQYYAFYFGVASPETHPGLWRRLMGEFGPHRKKHNPWPDIDFSNALIGADLRVELMSRHGDVRGLLRDMRAYRMPMVRRTGTLWEHLSDSASCNHGFAAHACHVLFRDALGVAEVGAPRRHLVLRLVPNGLRHCAGTIPVAGGKLVVRWRKQARTLALETKIPSGWTVAVENRTGLDLDWKQR